MFHLRYFVAVAEELNFSRAARKLHMAAPPLSQRIKDLEQELDSRLFERDTHGVALTPEGTALLPLARDVIARFDALRWRTKAAGDHDRSVLLVGAPPLLHPVLREGITETQHRVAERAELKLWPGPSSGLVEAVHDGRLAFCLARAPIGHHDLAVDEIYTEKLGAAVPAELFPDADSVRLTELTELAFTSGPVSLESTFLRQLDAGFDAAGIRRRLPSTPTDVSGISELIAGGLAFSVAMLDPASPIHRYDTGKVRILPFADFEATLTTALVWHPGRAAADAGTAAAVAAAREVFSPPK
jgi:DNA-binding transcriptional LysR family regulator